MNRWINIAGQQFGFWLVLRINPKRDRWGTVLWDCRCCCGVERTVLGFTLRYGQSTNCGCVQREKQKKRLTKHGMSKTRVYCAYAQMLQRCLNPRHRRYSDYGGRDDPITICERWRGEHGFVNFFADMGHPPPGMSLERRDNSRGYSPDNCKWATYTEQNANRRPPKRQKRRRAKLDDIRAYAVALSRARAASGARGAS